MNIGLWKFTWMSSSCFRDDFWSGFAGKHNWGPAGCAAKRCFFHEKGVGFIGDFHTTVSFLCFVCVFLWICVCVWERYIKNKKRRENDKEREQETKREGEREKGVGFLGDFHTAASMCVREREIEIH